MAIGEQIHWFLTNRCNENCSCCFRASEAKGAGQVTLEKLASTLADGKIKQVTLGGGEPTLVKGLDRITRILADGKIDVRLHTNGLLLTPELIKRISPYLASIAIPLDSLNERVQTQIRDDKFIPTLRRIDELSKQIKDSGLTLGYHTVFTDLNSGEIPRIYDFLDKTGFDYWRIYEFNANLARQRLIDTAKRSLSEGESERVLREYLNISLLEGPISHEKGCTDCLLAKFLLMEEKMQRSKDARVNFVAVRDPKPPYAFLYNSGNLHFYRWFSGAKMRTLGNVFSENLPKLMKKLQGIEKKGRVYDLESQNEWFNATMGDVPIWARLDEGAYFSEEIEEINPRYEQRVLQLSELYEQRREKLWQIYKLELQAA